MQNWIIRYVDDIHDRTLSTGCSIAQALEQLLPTYSKALLEKLSAAGDDLTRIVQLELQRRLEAADGLRDRWIVMARINPGGYDYLVEGRNPMSSPKHWTCTPGEAARRCSFDSEAQAKRFIGGAFLQLTIDQFSIQPTRFAAGSEEDSVDRGERATDVQ